MTDNREVSFTLRVVDAASSFLKQIESAAAKTTEKFFSLGSILQSFGGIIGGLSLGVLIKDLVDLGTAADDAFRRIAANLPTFTEGISDLRDSITGLAKETGRALTDLQSTAADIAKFGVESAADLQQQLAASVKLADATGVTTADSAQLLIQLRRQFGLTGDEALGMAAKIASLAKGKVGVDELFNAFRASTVVFEKLGVDADTGIRAIAAIVGSGIAARQVRTILNEAPDKNFIEHLASQASISGDALDDLSKRAGYVEDGIGRAGQKIKTDFVDAWQRLGDTVLPPIEAALTHVLSLLTDIAKALPNVLLQSARFMTGQGIANPFAGSSSGYVYAQMTAPVKGVPDAPRTKLDIGPSKAELDALAALKTKLDESALSYQQLQERTEGARTKSDEMSDALERWRVHAEQVNAEATKLGQKGIDVASAYGKMKAAISEIHADEEMKAAATAAEQQAQAQEELSGIVSKYVGGPLAQKQAEEQKDIATLEKLAAKQAVAGDVAGMMSTLAVVKQVSDAWVVYSAAIADSIATSDGIQQTNQWLQDTHVTIDEILDEYDSYLVRLSMLKQRQQEVKDTNKPAYEELGKEINQVNALLDAMWGRIINIEKDHRTAVKAMVTSWKEVGSAIIGAGESLGIFNAQTGKSLNSVLSMAEAAAELGTNTAAGVAGLITGGAGLLSSIFSKQANPYNADIDKNTAALQQLTRGISEMSSKLSGSGATSALSLLTPDFFRSAMNQVAKKGKDDINVDKILSADQINTLQTAAKALGITLDNSVGSYAALAAALRAGIPLLGKFGSTVADMVNEMDAEKQIFGDKGPLDDLSKLSAKLGPMSAGLASIFQGIDTSKALSPENIALVRQRVQDLFTQMEGKGLSADQLGQLGGDDFLKFLEQIIGDLNTMAPAAAAAAKGVDALKAGLTDLANTAKIMDETPVQQLADKTKLYGDQFGSGFSSLSDGLDLSKQADLQAFDQRLKDFWKGIEDGTITVDTSVFSLDDWKNAILDVDAATKAAGATFETVAQQFADGLNSLTTGFSVFGTSSSDQAKGYASYYNLGDLGDLSTQSGVDAAIAMLEGEYKNLDPTDPNYKQNVQGILSTLGALRSINFGSGGAGGAGGGSTDTGSTSAAVAGFQSLTTIQGDQLWAELHLHTGIFTDIRSILLGAFGAGNLRGASGVGGGLSVGPVNIHVTTQSEDAGAFGTQVADAFVREIDVKFGRQALLQKIQNGDIGQ